MTGLLIGPEDQERGLGAAELFVEDIPPLTALAVRAGLDVAAAADWPEPGDEELPKLAGFVHSTFNPLVAATAGRCLQRRAESAPSAVTAIVLVTSTGDVASAAHVAAAVDTGGRVGPLFFFQSVPNAVAGHVAARWQLTGPVVCVDSTDAGLTVARLLLADGDADEVLVILLEQAAAPEAITGTSHDTASAVVVVERGAP
ncbi:beta-ketoacyl synthase chain length factor [Dactylosporangium sp. NPDC005555]|uniref:beta-ketoacyl synthase chain length factor n=1 Tax=Dactylosporangium sp. NPDC005555 TaxID=3154889 RepID=UPI00339E7FBA